jgi:enoyl-CoA hydratase/carnithine racemase
LSRWKSALRFSSASPSSCISGSSDRDEGLETSQSEGLSLEASLFGLCAGTEDKQEGTQAFLQKRSPQFQGR